MEAYRSMGVPFLNRSDPIDRFKVLSVSAGRCGCGGDFGQGRDQAPSSLRGGDGGDEHLRHPLERFG